MFTLPVGPEPLITAARAAEADSFMVEPGALETVSLASRFAVSIEG
ncbi:hypothetical protein [Sorangium sp. So ce117]